LQYIHDRTVGRPDSVGKTLGRATHTAILEPDVFESRYAIYDGKIRKGEAWNKFCEENKGKDGLKREEYDAIMRVQKAVFRNPVASKYLSKGTPEHTITWNDRTTNIPCKARLDFFSLADGPVIIDLKGTADIRADYFRREAGKSGYHQQLAWYREGIATLGHGPGWDQTPCVIIAVEFKAPHDVAVFRMGEDELYAGWCDCLDMLQRVATCKIENRWPGVYETEQELTLRKWELGIPDDNAEDLGLEFTEEAAE
jgi:hypothetical protein